MLGGKCLFIIVGGKNNGRQKSVYYYGRQKSLLLWAGKEYLSLWGAKECLLLWAGKESLCTMYVIKSVYYCGQERCYLGSDGNRAGGNGVAAKKNTCRNLPELPKKQAKLHKFTK